MVTKDAPGLELRERVLGACSSLAMGPPGTIAHDAAVVKHRRDELGHSTVATVGQDAAMGLAQCLDARASVVNRIVAIAGAARRGRDDAQVTLAHEDLCVARPAVVLGSGGAGVIAGRNERAVDDPGLPTISRRRTIELGEPWRQRCHDAMDRRRGESSHRRELADREVRAQGPHTPPGSGDELSRTTVDPGGESAEVAERGSRAERETARPERAGDGSSLSEP